jgi:hypothetical protein
MAVVAAALLGVATVWAQILNLAAPMDVRFVGTMQPFAESQAGGLNTLTIYIDSQKLLFNVSEVYTQQGRDPVGLLLNHIWPPELYFSGPAQRLAPIKDAANLGKKFTIEGFLYAGDNLFTVMAVKVG